MPRYRIVFMGSPHFAIPALQKLAKKHYICAVYTQPAKPAGRGMKLTPVPVANFAKSSGLPLFSPPSLALNEVRLQLASHKADLFVVVAYGLLLKKVILDMPTLGCINGHASLLPRWRGAAPIQRAIEAGDNQTGMSAMLMDEGLDTGKVLAQRICKIDKSETAGSLHKKLAEINATLLEHVVMDFINLHHLAKSQDHNLATYAAKITSQDAKIDWSLSSADLDRRIRAFTPFPGAWCQGPKGRLRILHARIVETNMPPDTPAGSVIVAQKNTLHVATGDGVLAIEQVQPAGKTSMSVAEFLNGHKLRNGQLLAVRVK